MQDGCNSCVFEGVEARVNKERLCVLRELVGKYPRTKMSASEKDHVGNKHYELFKFARQHADDTFP